MEVAKRWQGIALGGRQGNRQGSRVEPQSDGQWVTGGSARSHDATRASFSYSGSGNYWHDVPGGKVGGAIRESGFNTSHRLQDTTSNLPTGGEWTSQGVGDGHTAWSWNFEYSGSGDYSYSPMGGLVSGTVLESGDRGASYREEYTEKFSDANGWRRTSGIRKNANHQRDAFSYSGSGHYTYDVPGGQVFGDVVESGGHMHFADHNVDETWQADDTWKAVGVESTDDVQTDNFSYTGSGGYKYDVTGGVVSGAITESGETSSASNRHTQSQIVAGDWVTTGTEATKSNRSFDMAYSGSGGYSYDVVGGAISGTIRESGRHAGADASTYEGALSDKGLWVRTAGTQKNRSRTDDQWSYSGSGGYSYDNYNFVSVQGEYRESGGHGRTNRSDTSSTWQTDGQWAQAGTRSASEKDETSFTYSGTGVYSYAVEGGSVGGDVSESGSGGTFHERKTSATQASDGQWTENGSADQNQFLRHDTSYSGSGTYSHYIYGGNAWGTIQESGSHGYQSSSNWSQTNTNGQWTETQNNASNGRYRKVDWSMSGEGAYAYDVVGGGVSGTMTESGTYRLDYLHSDVRNGTADDEVADAHTRETLDRTYGNSFSGTGTYQYDIVDGSVGGEITESGSYAYSDAASWESKSHRVGSASNSQYTNAYSARDRQSYRNSYVGSGGYSYAVVGGQVDGDISESGSYAYDRAYDRTNSYNQANDVYSDHSTEDSDTSESRTYRNSFVGSGHYAYDVVGGAVSGEIAESGAYSWNWDQQYDSHYQDGKWTGNSQSNTKSQSVYKNEFSGSGGYSYDIYGGAVSGEIVESGGYSYQMQYVDSSKNGVSTWNRKTSDRSELDRSFSGSGQYVHDYWNGQMSGSVSESGSYDYLRTSTTNDSHQGSTSTSKLDHGAQYQRSFEGEGAYSYDFYYGAVSGTMQESGAYASKWRQKDEYDGTWSNDYEYAANGGYQFSSSGTGTYSYGVTGGQVSGTIAEDSQYVSGWSNTSEWSANQSGATSSDHTWNSFQSGGYGSTYSGSGTYGFEYSNMSVTGTVVESGGGGNSFSNSSNSHYGSNGASSFSSGSYGGTSNSNGYYTATNAGSGAYSSSTTTSNASYASSGEPTYVETTFINETYVDGGTYGAGYTSQSSSGGSWNNATSSSGSSSSGSSWSNGGSKYSYAGYGGTTTVQTNSDGTTSVSGSSWNGTSSGYGGGPGSYGMGYGWGYGYGYGYGYAWGNAWGYGGESLSQYHGGYTAADTGYGGASSYYGHHFGQTATSGWYGGGYQSWNALGVLNWNYSPGVADPNNEGLGSVGGPWASNPLDAHDWSGDAGLTLGNGLSEGRFSVATPLSASANPLAPGASGQSLLGVGEPTGWGWGSGWSWGGWGGWGGWTSGATALGGLGVVNYVFGGQNNVDRSFRVNVDQPQKPADAANHADDHGTSDNDRDVTYSKASNGDTVTTVIDPRTGAFEISVTPNVADQPGVLSSSKDRTGDDFRGLQAKIPAAPANRASLVRDLRPGSLNAPESSTLGGSGRDKTPLPFATGSKQPSTPPSTSPNVKPSPPRSPSSSPFNSGFGFGAGFNAASEEAEQRRNAELAAMRAARAASRQSQLDHALAQGWITASQAQAIGAAYEDSWKQAWDYTYSDILATRALNLGIISQSELDDLRKNEIYRWRFGWNESPRRVVERYIASAQLRKNPKSTPNEGAAIGPGNSQGTSQGSLGSAGGGGDNGGGNGVAAGALAFGEEPQKKRAGKYGVLPSIPNHQNDHLPSQGALKAYADREKRRQTGQGLTSKERDKIMNATGAYPVPKQDHSDKSITLGGRQHTKDPATGMSRLETDAKSKDSLRAAMERDMERMGVPPADRETLRSILEQFLKDVDAGTFWS